MDGFEYAVVTEMFVGAIEVVAVPVFVLVWIAGYVFGRVVGMSIK